MFWINKWSSWVAKNNVRWQCFDDFVKKQRRVSEGVTLTLEQTLCSPHSILPTFNYNNCVRITTEICYLDVTTVKGISEYLSNYLKQESMEISIEFF